LNNNFSTKCVISIHSKGVKLRAGGPHWNMQQDATVEIFRYFSINTLRTGDADLRFYVTTVQDG